jgi:hypothetical protein
MKAIGILAGFLNLPMEDVFDMAILAHDTDAQIDNSDWTDHEYAAWRAGQY